MNTPDTAPKDREILAKFDTWPWFTVCRWDYKAKHFIYSKLQQEVTGEYYFENDYDDNVTEWMEVPK